MLIGTVERPSPATHKRSSTSEQRHLRVVEEPAETVGPTTRNVPNRSESHKWERTNKFPATGRRLGVLNDTLTEAALGLTGLAVAAALFLVDSSGLITMFAIAVAAQSLMYLASPALALIADRDLSTGNAALSRAEQFKTALRAQSASV